MDNLTRLNAVASEAATLALTLPDFRLESVPEELAHLFTRENLLQQAASSIKMISTFEEIIEDAEAASPPLDGDEIVVATIVDDEQ